MGTQIYIKAGWGYWDTTKYPRGGCFRRAAEKIAVYNVKPSSLPREYEVRIGGGDTTAIVTEDALENIAVAS